MYRFWVFLHVAGVLGFVFAHGASAMASFRIRGERDPSAIRAALTLSSMAMPLMYVSLLVLLAAGIVAGFMGDHWGSGWIWTALGLILLVIMGMYGMATRFYARLREAVGVPTGRGQAEPGPPASQEEIERMTASPLPLRIAAVGGVGLLAILWLMIFKPF